MLLRRPLASCLILAAAALAIYLPDVGHGFVKDDFGWIAGSRLSADILLGAPTGFFRPAVSASFAINRTLCGLSPFCYGLTNLALLVGTALGVAFLARTVGLARGASLAAAAIWIFNWHGINMATLWISGRTALLLTLFATWGAAALLRGHWTVGLPLVLLAMLSKEEAVALPMILAWGLGRGRLGAGSPRTRAVAILGGVLVLAVYLLLRLNSGAFTPGTAPSYYQLDFTLERLISNLLQYADRAATFAGVVLVLFWIVARPGRLTLAPSDRPTMVFGAVWCALGFALTIFLPVRSSLYVCFPSVGIALVAALVLERWWSATPARGQSRAVAAGLLLPFALWPVYHARNRGSVGEAELSQATLMALQRIASERGAGAPGTIVTLRDEPGARPSLNDAFGTIAQGAADLMIAPKIVVWIDPPPRDAALAGLQPPARSDVTIALRDGVLVRLP